MPDEPQNPTPEENSIPPSPQEPTEPAPINTAHSEPSVAPPKAPEATGDDFPVKSTDIPPSDSTPVEAPKEPEISSQNEPNSEPKNTSKPETAQILVNEPLENETETSNEQAKPVSVNSKSSLARQLLITARNAIQFRKRKKLDKVMSLFLQQSKITNDEVEKFLHISDATATRYLSILEKENKIRQVGKTGKGVSYSRI